MEQWALAAANIVPTLIIEVLFALYEANTEAPCQYIEIDGNLTLSPSPRKERYAAHFARRYHTRVVAATISGETTSRTLRQLVLNTIKSSGVLGAMLELGSDGITRVMTMEVWQEVRERLIDICDIMKPLALAWNDPDPRQDLQSASWNQLAWSGLIISADVTAVAKTIESIEELHADFFTIEVICEDCFGETEIVTAFEAMKREAEENVRDLEDKMGERSSWSQEWIQKAEEYESEAVHAKEELAVSYTTLPIATIYPAASH